MNSSSSPSNHQDQERQKGQITRLLDYERKLSRRNGTIATSIIRVRDLVSVKERYTFHLPPTATKNYKREQDIQKLGVLLSDKNLLKIIPTTKVTRLRENAYRMMTILDPLPDVGDSGITQREKRLFDYIQTCISGKKLNTRWKVIRCTQQLFLPHLACCIIFVCANN